MRNWKQCLCKILGWQTKHYGMLWYFLELSNKVSDSHNGEFTFKPSFCRRRRPRVLESLKNCSDGELFKNTVRIKYFSSQDLAHTCKQVKTGSTWSIITGTNSLFLCLCLCLCRSLDWWKRSRHAPIIGHSDPDLMRTYQKQYGGRFRLSRIESNMPFCACICPYAYAYAYENQTYEFSHYPLPRSE